MRVGVARNHVRQAGKSQEQWLLVFRLQSWRSCSRGVNEGAQRIAGRGVRSYADPSRGNGVGGGRQHSCTEDCLGRTGTPWPWSLARPGPCTQTNFAAGWG